MRYCPVFPGDTRIMVIRVPDLLPEQIVAKSRWNMKLEKEASHFLYTLMHLELPPIMDRLRIPVVATASKRQAEDDNRSPLEAFIDEHCERVSGAKEIVFKDFYTRFIEQVSATEKHQWRKARAQREIPVKHPLVPGGGNKRYLLGLTWKTVEGGDA
jgi:hypothetical protein